MAASAAAGEKAARARDARPRSAVSHIDLSFFSTSDLFREIGDAPAHRTGRAPARQHKQHQHQQQ